MAYARTGDFDHAIQTLKRTLDLDPSNFSAAYNLGVAYLQKKDDAGGDGRVSSIAELSRPTMLWVIAVWEKCCFIRDRWMTRSPSFGARWNWLRKDPGNHAALAKALSAKGLNGEAQEEMRKAQQQARPQ